MLAKALAPSRWPIFALTDPLRDCQPVNFCGAPQARSGRLLTHKGAPRATGPFGRLFLWLSSQSGHLRAFRFLAGVLLELLVRAERDGLLAVGLDVASLAQRKARLLVNMADQILLGLGARLGQHGAATILIRAYRSNDCSDHVTIPHGGSDRLKHESNDALTPRVAVGSVVEAVTYAIGGEEFLV